MTIEYLKYNFQVKNIFPNFPSRGVKAKNIKIFRCSKVHLVGTLNLCLKMPDSMKKVWAQSDQCDPRKSPNTIENLLFWQFSIFWHILDVFSTQDDPIELFEMSIFFLFWPTLTLLEGTLGKIFLTRKLYFWYSIVIEHEIKHLTKTFSTKREEWHTLIWDYSSHVVKV